jgi:AcrR family transcriptional regulator
LSQLSILNYTDLVTTSTEQPLTRGHKKKARTRRLLLDTALEVLSEHGEGFSVADIAARAGVSHGTFYNYFGDRDELVAALVPYIVEGFAARSALEVADPDPAARFALITARALANAVTAPETVRVALRLEAVQRALLVDGPLAYLRQDLVDGHASGRFPDAPDDGTFDVVLGSLLLAARRVVEGETGLDYRRSVIGRLLQALGERS